MLHGFSLGHRNRSSPGDSITVIASIAAAAP
jgi:hypothetical protein